MSGGGGTLVPEDRRERVYKLAERVRRSSPLPMHSNESRTFSVEFKSLFTLGIRLTGFFDVACYLYKQRIDLALPILLRANIELLETIVFYYLDGSGTQDLENSLKYRNLKSARKQFERFVKISEGYMQDQLRELDSEIARLTERMVPSAFSETKLLSLAKKTDYGLFQRLEELIVAKSHCNSFLHVTDISIKYHIDPRAGTGDHFRVIPDYSPSGDLLMCFHIITFVLSTKVLWAITQDLSHSFQEESFLREVDGIVKDILNRSDR